MATWAKAELAVAMGTSQDGSHAHELGMHTIRQCTESFLAEHFQLSREEPAINILGLHNVAIMS